MTDEPSADLSPIDRPCLTEHDLWLVLHEGCGQGTEGTAIDHHVDRCTACLGLLADFARVLPFLLSQTTDARPGA